MTPDEAGTIDRDGVAIHFEVYGTGATTLLLIPPAPITHSRIWKAQIPHLARRYRVVTFDGRGSTKQWEDAVGWAMEPTGEILAANEEAQDLDPPGRERFEEQP